MPPCATKVVFRLWNRIVRRDNWSAGHLGRPAEPYGVLFRHVLESWLKDPHPFCRAVAFGMVGRGVRFTKISSSSSSSSLSKPTPHGHCWTNPNPSDLGPPPPFTPTHFTALGRVDHVAPTKRPYILGGGDIFLSPDGGAGWLRNFTAEGPCFLMSSLSETGIPHLWTSVVGWTDLWHLIASNQKYWKVACASLRHTLCLFFQVR